MPSLLPLLALLAQETTSTTAVPRIVGEPLDRGVLFAASAALLVAILLAGLVVSRRTKRGGDPASR